MEVDETGWEGMCGFFMMVYLWVRFHFPVKTFKEKPAAAAPWSPVD